MRRVLLLAGEGLASLSQSIEKQDQLAGKLGREDLRGLAASRRGISKFIAKYGEAGSIGRQTGSRRPSKITAEVKEIVEEQMQTDDETSAHQLHRLLKSCGYNISLCTILRCRTALGWTFRSSSYCQLIHHANKQKRLDWAERCTDLAFNDVVWTDVYDST